MHRLRLLFTVLFATASFACSTESTEQEPSLVEDAVAEDAPGEDALSDAHTGDTRDAGAADGESDAISTDGTLADTSAVDDTSGGDATPSEDATGDVAPETAPSCEPNPCSSVDRMRCVIGLLDGGGGVQCLCNAGTHEEGSVCVPDATCQPTTCNGHGTCSGSGGSVGCACDEGWKGTSCQTCDESKGYHPDGAGGCTTDLCKPSPCDATANKVCVVEGTNAACKCASGYHGDGMGGCVVDETCTATTCSGHGTCSTVDGKTSCACAEGYLAPSCATCAATHHPDGAGGCTTDACTPNQCTAANKTTCVADPTKSNGYRCDCVTGFHDDGQGGCTQNPCKPDPCLASNQACQDNGNGSHTCFTPPCDDKNPCTTDAVVDGQCVHTNVADDAPCSTTLCKSGMKCTAGTCGGGVDVTCNDDNPCTKDSCDAAKGCQAQNDDTLVPADAYDCTVDSCLAGVAKHISTNARCDDGKWCTGVETCNPASASANAKGCVTSNVPQPPSLPNPCRYYAACDDATQSFPLITRAVGESCNDGVQCTSDDKCTADGACRGTIATSCAVTGTTCTATTSFTPAIDFGMANLTGAFTLGGGTIPTTSKGGDVEIYLVNKATGSRQRIGGPRYQYASPNYTLISGTASYATIVMPGVFDVLFRRGWNYAEGGNYVYTTTAGDTLPDGDQLLKTNVVVGPGDNKLDVDFDLATIAGSFTLNGGAIPTTSKGGDVEIYLVNKVTGSRQRIGGPRYQYASPNYTLISGSAAYSTIVMPGTYDVLYRRGWNYAAGGSYVYTTTAGDTLADGDVILKKDVAVTKGANTLDLDFGLSTVSGTFKLSGGAIPTTSKGGDVDIYLVNKETGSRQRIGGPRYQYASPNYTLIAGTAAYSTMIMPGTYDVIYRRGWNYAAGGNYVYTTTAGDTLAGGDVILQTNVAIGNGANTLDVDFGMATVSGAFTLNGGAIPTTSKGGDVDIYLVNKATGSRQRIGGPRYQYASPNYTLISGSASYATLVMPGTYDVLYRRGWNYAEGGNYIYTTTAGDTLADGDQVLQTNVVLGNGANTLDVDFGLASVSGAFTLSGGAIPTTSKGGDVEIYLVNKVTGSRQRIGGPRYQYASPNYTLISGTASYATTVMPGTYDVLFRRGWNYAEGGNYVYTTTAGDTLPDGDQILQTNVVIANGSNSLSVDFTQRTVAGSFTLGGGPIPTTSKGGDVEIYLVNKITGSRQRIGGPRYQYASPNYTLINGTAAYSSIIMPGTYDLLFRRGWNYADGGNYVYTTTTGDTLPDADQYLKACVIVP